MRSPRTAAGEQPPPAETREIPRTATKTHHSQNKQTTLPTKTQNILGTNFIKTTSSSILFTRQHITPAASCGLWEEMETDGRSPEAPLDPTASSSPRGLAGLLLHSTSQAGRAVGQLNGCPHFWIHSQALISISKPHTRLKKHQEPSLRCCCRYRSVLAPLL